MYLLDTNVISEMRIRSRTHPKVKAWELGIDLSATFLSVVTIMEIELGALLKQRKDPMQAKVFRTWLHEKVLPEYQGRILYVDTQIALRCAALHVPKTRSYRDAFIASTALEHGLIVVTRNVTDFAYTGVKLINPWQ